MREEHVEEIRGVDGTGERLPVYAVASDAVSSALQSRSNSCRRVRWLYGECMASRNV